MRFRRAPRVANVVIFCGECGHDFTVAIELPRKTRPDVALETLMAAGAFAPSCPRCGAVYQSVTLSAEPHPRLARAQRAEKQAAERKGPVIRFAVGSPESGRSLVWRVWVNRNDVYIAARDYGGELKVSLHEDHAHWRFAFTSDHMRGPRPLVRDRLVDEWERPAEFAPGWRKAFHIFVPHTEIVRYESDFTKEGEVVWLPAPQPDCHVEFTVLFSTPDAARGGRGFPTAEGYTNDTEVVAVLPLANGESVWVMAHEAPNPAWLVERLEQVRSEGLARLEESIDPKAAPNLAPRILAFSKLDDDVRYYLDMALPA